MTSPHVTATGATWRILQLAMLLATAGFLVAAWVRPAPSLALFWGVVVPLLPLSFLVTPLLWRAVCPLATVNMLANRPGGRRLSPQVTRWAGAPAIVALALLVPARHFAFNTHGGWLVALVVVATVAAAALGTHFEARAGFCNLLCPVLPVERLYGQFPVVDVGNPRCAACTVCTPRGCLDLAGAKAMSQLLGPRRRTRAWLFSAFGMFAVAFPGFVVGYFTVNTAATPGAVAIYAHVLGYALAGAVLLGAIITASSLTAARALPLLGAISVAAYYWFAVPVVLRAVGVASTAAEWGGRGAMALVIAWWVRRALLLAGATTLPPRALPVATGD